MQWPYKAISEKFCHVGRVVRTHATPSVGSHIRKNSAPQRLRWATKINLLKQKSGMITIHNYTTAQYAKAGFSWYEIQVKDAY